jgi:hypothetical protein
VWSHYKCELEHIDRYSERQDEQDLITGMTEIGRVACEWVCKVVATQRLEKLTISRRYRRRFKTFLEVTCDNWPAMVV